MSNSEILKKIKEGINKSGFPLELEIGNILDENDWNYSIGNLYEDFETQKVRELDITASKIINGVNVHLIIECKKSEDRQLVLYAPRNNKLFLVHNSFFKMFPNLKQKGKNNYFDSAKTVAEVFKELRHFDKEVPFSNSLIVTKGSIVTEENIKYLSSINGMIKYSIHSASDGYIETNLRSIFLYVLIFDGKLFQLSSSKSEKFELREINYGQFKYRPHFKFNSTSTNADYIETAKQFGLNFIIEFMNPDQFENYILELTNIFQRMKRKDMADWGQPWPRVPYRIRTRKKQ